MARDEGLEELLRECLQAEPGLTEKAMFGGRAWLLNGGRSSLCSSGSGDLYLKPEMGKGGVSSSWRPLALRRRRRFP
jgi:hypothetical protein